MTQTFNTPSPDRNRTSYRPFAALLALAAMATFWLPTLTNPAEASPSTQFASAGAAQGAASATVIVIAATAAPVLM